MHDNNLDNLEHLEHKLRTERTRAVLSENANKRIRNNLLLAIAQKKTESTREKDAPQGVFSRMFTDIVQTRRTFVFGTSALAVVLLVSVVAYSQFSRRVTNPSAGQKIADTTISNDTSNSANVTPEVSPTPEVVDNTPREKPDPSLVASTNPRDIGLPIGRGMYEGSGIGGGGIETEFKCPISPSLDNAWQTISCNDIEVSYPSHWFREGLVPKENDGRQLSFLSVYSGSDNTKERARFELRVYDLNADETIDSAILAEKKMWLGEHNSDYPGYKKTTIGGIDAWVVENNAETNWYGGFSHVSKPHTVKRMIAGHNNRLSIVLAEYHNDSEESRLIDSMFETMKFVQ